MDTSLFQIGYLIIFNYFMIYYLCGNYDKYVFGERRDGFLNLKPFMLKQTADKCCL